MCGVCRVDQIVSDGTGRRCVVLAAVSVVVRLMHLILCIVLRVSIIYNCKLFKLFLRVRQIVSKIKINKLLPHQNRETFLTALFAAHFSQPAADVSWPTSSDTVLPL